MAAKRTQGMIWLMAILAIGIGLASYRYLLPGQPGAPPQVIANTLNRLGGIPAHAVIAATALILGAGQFFPYVRSRWPAWHRRAGTVYVVCSVLGGSAGFVLAFGSTAGPVATAGFALLGFGWVGCTVIAWRFARVRNLVRHRRWMARSYGLAFAAVTLRLYLPIAAIAQFDFVQSYRVISFLAWVPNVIFVEALLARRGRTPRPLGAPA